MIDDAAGVRLILSKNLEHAGFDVIAADGARQGLALSRSWNPDVIVLDLMIPDVDGFEALDRLARADHPVAPVIVLTAMHVADVRDRCMGAGASLVLAKPFEPQTLAFEIERILAEARQSVELRSI